MRAVLLDAERLLLGRNYLNTLLEGREMLEGAIAELVAKILEKMFNKSENSSCTSTRGVLCLEEVRFSGLDQNQYDRLEKCAETQY